MLMMKPLLILRCNNQRGGGQVLTPAINKHMFHLDFFTY